MNDSKHEVTKLTHGPDPIPFRGIQVSRWNRSQAMEFTAKSTEGLQRSLRESGLLHPITLMAVADKTADKDVTRYEIIAGAHRFNALMQLRGEDGLLQPGEYTLVPEGTVDEEVLAISLSENAERQSLSPAQEAFYAARLQEETQLTQLKLSTLMQKPRQWLAAATRLKNRWEELPRSWQADLCASPDGPESERAIITFSHWQEVSGKLPAQKLGQGEIKLLEKARADKLTARKISYEMDSYVQRLGRGDTMEEAEARADQPGAETDGRPVEQGTPASTESTNAPEVDTTRDPDFNTILDLLKKAQRACGDNMELVGVILRVINRVKKVYRDDYQPVK